MDDDYELPGMPFKYGPGRPMTDDDRAFLKGLIGAYWRTMPPDNFGRSDRCPEGVLTHSEVHKLANLILECRLPTCIGPGMFGLPGYSMAVFDSPDPQSTLAGKPDVLFMLVNTHMKWNKDELGTRHQKSWIFFTGFTHSPDNLTLLDYHGIGRPGTRRSLDY